MALTLVVFAGFYATPRHTVHYANTLTQALHGQLVLLHVNRASLFDPYALMAESYHQEELDRQTETAAALYRLAEELPTQPTVEVATDLLPEVAQDLATRHHPALFVLSQPDPERPDSSVAQACAELLRAGHFPLLLVPSTAPADQPPRRILIAADRESFALAANAQPLRQLLALPGAELIVAHVSSGVEDDAGCSAALRAVQLSGLVKGLPTPELRGYEHDNYAEGILAAIQDTQADLVIVLARERSYLGELFHQSVTAHLLAHCPVPVLVLPVAAPVAAPDSGQLAAAALLTNSVLTGLAPAN
ncbi:universal stress protein [Hymenobacter antarcticus]|uniref:UspA domain-containing protein n=1 Tax=Hymenobacter antarcticus TaxID=486270 RepID=A0ABP7R2N0_9BACT